MWGGGVNLVSSTPSGAESKEVVSADYVAEKADSRIENKFNQSVTNCITEIPQDIKLDLTDGVLTLKAGSKLYVPNGFESDGTTKKFKVHITDKEYSYIEPIPSKEMSLVIFLNFNESDTAISIARRGNNSSGETIPDNYTGAFYNTTTNIVEHYSNGAKQNYTSSLPFALITSNTNTEKNIKTIDQIFNGFGYIGSTIFALPGVKGLIPNGKNKDGSLNNLSFETTKVLTDTETYSRDMRMRFFIRYDGVLDNTTAYSYSEQDNYNRSSVNNAIGKACITGSFKRGTNGIITDFTIPKIFQYADHADGTFLSAQSMPSGKYIDLSLGATGAKYIAPANGWVFVEKTATATGQLLIINSAYGELISCAASSSQIVSCVYPIKRGMYFLVKYSTAGETRYFRLIYAEGEAP